MSYEKNIWKTGDVITSTKLNRMEDGIANAGGILVIGGLTVGMNQTSYQFIGTADKTWQEIDNALAAGVRCVVVGSGMGGHIQLIVSGTRCDNENYIFYISDGQNDPIFFTTTSADGYPTTDVFSPPPDDFDGQ